MRGVGVDRRLELTTVLATQLQRIDLELAARHRLAVAILVDTMKSLESPLQLKLLLCM
jgi:hypothetical protein